MFLILCLIEAQFLMHSGHRAEEVEGGTEEMKVHFFQKEFKRQFEKNSLFVKMVCPLRNEGSGFMYTMKYFLYVFNIVKWRRRMRQGRENLYFLLYVAIWKLSSMLLTSCSPSVLLHWERRANRVHQSSLSGLSWHDAGLGHGSRYMI